MLRGSLVFTVAGDPATARRTGSASRGVSIRAVEAITELDHPVAGTLLTRLRDAETDGVTFRALARRLGLLLVAEALRAVRTTECRVRTPLAPTTGTESTEQLVAVPVLRAGLGLLDSVMAIAPEADVGMVGLRRDEHDFTARPYLTELPPLDGRLALVLEPMLATGGSASQAVAACAAARAVVVVSVVAAPEGLQRLTADHPDARVVVAAIDDGLDARGFIVPGLGDFGDRLLGTG